MSSSAHPVNPSLSTFNLIVQDTAIRYMYFGRFETNEDKGVKIDEEMRARATSTTTIIYAGFAPQLYAISRSLILRQDNTQAHGTSQSIGLAGNGSLALQNALIEDRQGIPRSRFRLISADEYFEGSSAPEDDLTEDGTFPFNPTCQRLSDTFDDRRFLLVTIVKSEKAGALEVVCAYLSMLRCFPKTSQTDQTTSNSFK